MINHILFISGDSMEGIKNIWIRNDDISKFDERYKMIIDLYKKYNLFSILCIIPSTIDERCIEYLSGYDNYCISQHGYNHKNYKKKLNLDYSVELSDLREQREVLEEILKGKKIIESLTGEQVDILTPPYNRIDPNIESILKEYFHVLSTYGDNKSTFDKDFNPNFDIIDWNTRTFDRDRFIRKMDYHLAKDYDIGLCIHHNFMTEEDIEFLDEYLNKIKDNKKIVLGRRLL